MGLGIESIRLLIRSKKAGVDFKNTITIGRHRMLLSEKDLQSVLQEEGVLKKNGSFKLERYAETFFSLLGAKQQVSLDASDYEESEVIHDLNDPIPEELKNKYNAVVDAGSLEHIFNFPVAIKNCMELLRVGGHFLSVTPTNNFMGHGFYQFSPELFFRIFNEANGFELKKMYFYTKGSNNQFYEVADPAEVLKRVTLVNSSPSFLFLLAQKKEEKPIFETTPQQYDYEHHAWKRNLNFKRAKKKKKSFLWFRKLIFNLLVKPYRNLVKTRKIVSRDIGTGAKDHFRQIR